MIGKVLVASSVGLLCGLIAYAPADKLVPRLLPADAGVQLYEISGSLLKGQAGQIEARGTRVDELAWDLHPLHLLTTQLAADVSLSYYTEDLGQDNTWLRTGVKYSLLGGQLRLTDLVASSGLEALQKPLKISYLPISGTLQLKLDDLQIDLSNEESGLWPSQLQGQAHLLDTRWKLGNAAELGQFSVTLSAEEGSLLASIEDSPQAKLALQGQAQINAQRQYTAALQVKPKQNTPSNVSNQMKALGRTDSQGWYQINNSGQLRGF